jgi:hypothetical protein
VPDARPPEFHKRGKTGQAAREQLYEKAPGPGVNVGKEGLQIDNSWDGNSLKASASD